MKDLVTSLNCLFDVTTNEACTEIIFSTHTRFRDETISLACFLSEVEEMNHGSRIEELGPRRISFEINDKKTLN